MIKGIIYSCILFVLLISCEKRTGEIIREERKIDYFNEIEINDIFNIYIKQDSTEKIMLEGGENVLPEIITKVEEGVLKIYNENSLRWTRDYERVSIWVTVVNLNKIAMFEPSNVVGLDTVKGDNLTIYALAGMNEGNLLLNYDYINFGSSHSTGGKMTIEGKVNRIRIECYNSLHLDAGNLLAKNVDALNKSIGDISVYCTNELKVNIRNDGNIYYKGNPDSIIAEIKGNGKLIEIE